MDMFIAGEWRAGSSRVAVIDPYTGETIDDVPVATADEVDDALAAAVRRRRAPR